MTIQQLKLMSSRELASFFANVKRTGLVDILKAELLGGYSKLNKASLVELVLDLVEGLVTTLTQMLKPLKPRKRIDEEVKMYREMIKKSNYDRTFTDVFTYSYSRYFIKNDNNNNEILDRSKYLKLVKYFHPDKPTGNEDKFKIIQDSYNNARKECESFDKISGNCNDEGFWGD